MLTIGETIGGYTPPGVPDGLGAFALDDDTVRVFMNHERQHSRGYAYSLDDGNVGSFTLTGARVSYVDVDRASLLPVASGLAYDKVFDANGNQASSVSFQPSFLSGFSRFCSGSMFEAEQFGAGRGLAERAYITGEEDGKASNAVGGAVWAVDPASSAIWQLPDLGRGAWENVAVLDTGSASTVALLLMDDSAPFNAGGDPQNEAAPLYLYVGTKDPLGDFPARNGLRGGSLFVWVADAPGVSTPADFHASGTEVGSWVQIDNARNLASASETGTTGYDEYGYPTQRTLWLRAEAAGAFGFSRPEDVSTNPFDGTVCALSSTGVDTYVSGVDTYGTVYSLATDFSDRSADLTIVYDGDADPTRALRSPDNLDWADDGFLYVQEDRAEVTDLSGVPLFGPGAVNPNEAGIVRIDPATGATARVANIDRSVVIDPTVANPLSAVDRLASTPGAWESSGIVDVSTLFGRAAGTLFLFDVQAHGISNQVGLDPSSRISDGDLVQGGQLAFLELVALGDNDCVASANSVGSGASIRAEGSTLVADNDFTLYAEGLPAHTPGVFFHGTAQQQTPFGNGTLCVGGFSVRLSPPVFSNSAGASTKPVDLTGTTAAWIVPGATLHFQLWYRDPAGGGFNLSDGLRISWL
ncbi:MAG: DUF839 domain-containing protein [Planctomycetes bacterium]|nr:DUF839 domain-containing protein [Planctomycetota bacterium]